jgi:hypothetical protein
MASRKNDATQLKTTVSVENSAWMAGRATLTEEIVNGPIKDVRVATKRVDFSNDLSEVNVNYVAEFLQPTENIMIF